MSACVYAKIKSNCLVCQLLSIANDMKKTRNMETPEQTEYRRIKMAHVMQERRKIETPDRVELMHKFIKTEV